MNTIRFAEVLLIEASSYGVGHSPISVVPQLRRTIAKKWVDSTFATKRNIHEAVITLYRSGCIIPLFIEESCHMVITETGYRVANQDSLRVRNEIMKLLEQPEQDLVQALSEQWTKCGLDLLPEGARLYDVSIMEHLPVIKQAPQAQPKETNVVHVKPGPQKSLMEEFDIDDDFLGEALSSPGSIRKGIATTVAMSGNINEPSELLKQLRSNIGAWMRLKAADVIAGGVKLSSVTKRYMGKGTTSDKAQMTKFFNPIVKQLTQATLLDFEEIIEDLSSEDDTQNNNLKEYHLQFTSVLQEGKREEDDEQVITKSEADSKQLKILKVAIDQKKRAKEKDRYEAENVLESVTELAYKNMEEIFTLFGLHEATADKLQQADVKSIVKGTAFSYRQHMKDFAKSSSQKQKKAVILRLGQTQKVFDDVMQKYSEAFITYASIKLFTDSLDAKFENDTLGIDTRNDQVKQLTKRGWAAVSIGQREQREQASMLKDDGSYQKIRYFAGHFGKEFLKVLEGGESGGIEANIENLSLADQYIQPQTAIGKYGKLSLNDNSPVILMKKTEKDNTTSFYGITVLPYFTTGDPKDMENEDIELSWLTYAFKIQKSEEEMKTVLKEKKALDYNRAKTFVFKSPQPLKTFAEWREKKSILGRVKFGNLIQDIRQNDIDNYKTMQMELRTWLKSSSSTKKVSKGSADKVETKADDKMSRTEQNKILQQWDGSIIGIDQRPEGKVPGKWWTKVDVVSDTRWQENQTNIRTAADTLGYIQVNDPTAVDAQRKEMAEKEEED